MTAPAISRASVLAAIVTVVLVVAAWTAGGSAMFSPGALHAADSTPAMLGGVQSHAELSRQCASCHVAPWGSDRMDGRCLDCHADIAGDMRDTSTLHGHLDDARQCVTCHTEHAGALARITRMEGLGEAHTRFGFALAAHRETASGKPFTCNECHTASSFAFDDDQCIACHRDYQRSFVQRHVADWGEGCRDCHDGVDLFSRETFAHDSTGLALHGKHTATSCAGRHAKVRTLAAFGDAPTTCVGCHRADDEHRGSLGDDCAACHTTSAWEGATVKHDEFPLDHGDEGVIPCKTCHETPRDYKSYTCYNCHEHSRERVQAEHRGEVSTSNLDDCVRCHRGGREGEGGEHGEERGRRRRHEH